MNQNQQAESGRIFAHLVRDLVLITMGIGVLIFALQLLGRALFGDSVSDEIMQEISERAMDISTHMASQQEAGGQTKQGYPFTVYITEDDFFEIVLENVPRDICDNLQDRWGNHVTSIYVNGILRREKEIPCQKQNQIGFEFNQNLDNRISDADKPTKKHCRSNADCDGCSVCRKGMCQSQCPAGKTCAVSMNGQGVCCPEDQFNQPVCCAYTDEESCCWGSDNCCPKERPIRLKDGTCVGCFDKTVFAVGTPLSVETCLKLCPNREDFGADELCMLPICRKGQFTNRQGECVDCHAGGAFDTSEKECLRCSGRVYQRGKCTLSCPEQSVMNENGLCESCDSVENIAVGQNGACQERCPNRENVGGQCVLKICPKGFVKNKSGACMACDEAAALPNMTAEMCHACPNREMLGEVCVLKCDAGSFRNINGQCVDCANPKAIPVNPGECLRCPNRLALQNYCFAECGRGQFRDQWGECHECSDFGSYPIKQSLSCAVCSDRSVLLYQNGQKGQAYCRPTACPIDYFSDRLGACHDCFDKAAVRLTRREECEKCPNRFWSVNEQTCFFKSVCKPGDVLDSDGTCQSCDPENGPFSVAGRINVCDSCPNRYVYGAWCRTCPADVRTLKTKEGCIKCGGKWDNRIALCMP